MRVIPVIDLRGGCVVRAVAGRRDEYRPLASPLIQRPTPGHVAQVFADLGFRALYVADLDAIQSGEPAWTDLAEILRVGTDVWLDAGPRTAAEAERLAEYEADGRGFARLLVGLECVDAPTRLDELAGVLGRQRAVFSLDLVEGRPLTQSADWEGWSVESIARRAITAGFRQLVILDLRRVGGRQGPPIAAWREAVARDFPDVEWIVGGGVRGVDDLLALDRAGISAALVATVLHDPERAVEIVGRWEPRIR